MSSFKAAPFKALSLLTLTLGGLMLLMFFVRLGTVPDLDFASTTASMAAVAVLGLLLMTFVGGSTIAAGLMTRAMFVDGRQQKLEVVDLVLFALPGLLTAVGLIATSNEANGWSLIAMVCFGLVILPFLQLLRHGVSQAPNGKGDTQRHDQSKSWPGSLGLFLRLVVAFIWLGSCVFAFLTLYDFWPTEREGASFRVVLILWIALCAVLNASMVLWSNKTRLEEAVGIALLSIAGLFGLSALSENWTGVPVAAVRALGLGEQAVGVVVTAVGCDTFNKAARGQVVCQLDNDNRTGWVCPVILRSRIGSPYVFELTSFDASGNWPVHAPSGRSDSGTSRVLKRIQIAKEDVKSWPSIDAFRMKDDGRSSTPISVDSTRVLTYLDQRLLKVNETQRRWLARQCGSTNGEATAATRAPNAPVSSKAQ